MGMAIQVQGSVMTSLPDPERVVREDQAHRRGISGSHIELETQDVVDRIKEPVESLLGMWVVVAANQDDAPALDPVTDRLRDLGSRGFYITHEVTQVKENIVGTHNVVDLIDQVIIHGFHCCEITSESTTDHLLAEVCV